MSKAITVGLLSGFLLTSTGATSANAAADHAKPSPTERPPIGLVLGGGGAKGAAHIGGLTTPAGFIQTQDIEDVIWQLVSDTDEVSNFDELPVSFRAVATDLVAGEMVVMGDGNLSVAMRASMALPGIFAPVQADDRILIDGGMQRNLPVDVGRELCADIVIAVWMTSPPKKAEDLATDAGF